MTTCTGTQPLTIASSLGRRVGTIVAAGELDVASAPLLAAEVERMAAAPQLHRLVVDLSGITFVDLHGLRAVADIRRRMPGRLRLSVVESAAVCRIADLARAA